jgi:two-component system chemotaxis response regulator CheY
MLKVVIIDGSAISRNLLSTILINGGHEVIGDSNTSAAGLARMIKLRPQIVCIDIGHAEDGGMETLDTIQSALPKALIFMISSKFEPDFIQSALQRGVHGFIVKPFNAATVLANIRNAILKIARQQKSKVHNPE